MQPQKATKTIIAIDIGGTLTKVGIHTSEKLAHLVLDEQHSPIDKLEIHLHGTQTIKSLMFYFQQYLHFQDFFQFLKEKLIPQSLVLDIIATGGGALKYQSSFNQLNQQFPNTEINYQMSLNEFQATLPMIRLFVDESEGLKFYQGSETKTELAVKITAEKNAHLSLELPLIWANIGSGMSVLKLEDDQGKIRCQRIGGSALGGGFFMGIQKIANPQFSFQKIAKNQQPPSLTSEQVLLMTACIENLSQIIHLYSDIHKIETILITGGLLRSEMVRKEFGGFLEGKNVWFTEIDGYLSIAGMLLGDCLGVK